jgi:hypothetical protein
LGSLEFKIKSRLRNPVARLAGTIETGVFSERPRRHTLSRGTSAGFHQSLGQLHGDDLRKALACATPGELNSSAIFVSVRRLLEFRAGLEAIWKKISSPFAVEAIEKSILHLW